MENAIERIFSQKKLETAIARNPFAKLNDVVFFMIEDAIVSRTLQPGTKINIIQISKTLNISRTPVKEALDSLKECGLVVTHGEKSGYYVFDITRHYIDDLFAVRSMFEGEAAYLCAKQNYHVNIAQGMELATSFRDAYYQNDFSAFTNKDLLFHKWLIRSTGNSILLKLYNGIERDLRYCAARSRYYLSNSAALTESFNKFEEVAHHHLSICNAIKQGMPQVAMQLSRAHLDCVWTSFYAIAPPE